MYVFALIFRVVVRDVKPLASDVANIVEIAELARLRIDENITFQNVLMVGQD